MVQIDVRSSQREQMIDLTEEVARLAKGVKSGVIWLHCPHTTAALTVQENSDPDVQHDLLTLLGKLIPRPGFRHSEGNADAHIKSSLIGITQPILVEDEQLILGQWQAIYFVELDGPRQRHILARVSSS